MMQMPAPYLSTTAAFAIAAASPALAEVTAADVWANTQAQVASLGGTLTGSLVANGSVTEVRDYSGVFALPMGLGAMTLTMDGVSLIDNGDGTLTYRYADGALVTFAMDVTGMVSASLSLRLSGADMAMIASGRPGDITYRYDIDEIGFALADVGLGGSALTGPEGASLENMDMSGTVTVSGLRGAIQVVEGALVETRATMGYRDMQYAFAFDAGPVTGTQSGMTGMSDSSVIYAAPAEGASLMALHSALRDGMRLAATLATGRSTAQQEVFADGNRVGYSNDVTGPSDMAVRIDQSVFALAARVDGYQFDTLDPNVPFPIKGRLGQIHTAFEIPLSASRNLQNFAYSLGLRDVIVDEALWAMIDPGQTLPRDPAQVRFDLTGQIASEIDLLDASGWMSAGLSDEVPVVLHSAELTDLVISAVGTEASGSGAFTFDMTDRTTFDGLPAPTGAASFRLAGANALLDTLIEMGVLSEEDAMGARMGMTMFMQPGDAADTLLATIEVDGATGAISANGQRVR